MPSKLDPAALVKGQRVRIVCPDGLAPDRVWEFVKGSVDRYHFLRFPSIVELKLYVLGDGKLHDADGQIVEVRDADPS